MQTGETTARANLCRSGSRELPNERKGGPFDTPVSCPAGYFFPDLRGGGVCGFIVCTNEPFFSFWESLPDLNCPAPGFLPPFFSAMVFSCNRCFLP
jgi:hypothetical protein